VSSAAVRLDLVTYKPKNTRPDDPQGTTRPAAADHLRGRSGAPVPEHIVSVAAVGQLPFLSTYQLLPSALPRCS
jgi:hypothetical protein